MDENKIFRVNDQGQWSVWPNSRVKLPGYFVNELQAMRAYKRYKVKTKLRKKISKE